MKVLYLITKSNWGGAQRYVFDLATHLPPGFEPVVAARGSGLLATKLNASGHRFVSTSAVGIFNVIRAERPDVVHTNSSLFGGIGAFCAWLLGVPKIIFTAHGWPFNENRNILWRAIVYKLSWLTSLFSNITITITQKDFEQGRRMWLVGHKMRLLNNGIEGTIPPLPSLNLREGEGGITIGTIAELTPNKGIKYLIEAAKQIPNARFVVIGEGELRSDLENRIQRSDLGARFKLAGFIPDANRHLKTFDIFVLPSLKEGLPYTLLEAGQAGLPVVASNIGGIPDIIGGETPCGELVEPKNPELLACALNALIKDAKLRQTLGQQLQARVQKEFSFEKFLSQTYELYK